jgi:hypothetical protein
VKVELVEAKLVEAELVEAELVEAELVEAELVEMSMRYSPCAKVLGRFYPTNFFIPPQLRAPTTHSTMPTLTYTCKG